MRLCCNPLSPVALRRGPGSRQILALSLGLVLAQSALAQGPPEVPSPAPAGATPAKDLDQLTVLATRRREPVHEVPLSIGVVQAQELERGSQQQLRDIVALLPGVNFSQTGGGTGQSEVSMRGITTGAQVGASVAMYIDDVPFGSSSAFAGGSSNALDLGLFDLSHVEVLRGPQGTLYGASAMGGLIKYVTQPPDSQSTYGTLAGEWGSIDGGGQRYLGRVAFNLPVIEGKAALRATLYQRGDDGFIREATSGVRVDGSKARGGRVALLLSPTEDANIQLTAMSQRSERDGSSIEDVDQDTGRPAYGARRRGLFTDEPFDVDLDLVSANLDWNLDWARLQVSSAWQRSRSEGQLDTSELYVPLLGGLGLNADGYALGYGFDVDKTTQEVRLTSADSRNLEWLAGIYYSDERGDRTQQLSMLDAQAQPLPFDVLTAAFPSQYQELAAYGTVTKYLGDRFDVTMGARHSRNRQETQQRTSGLLGTPAPDAKDKESVSTWLASGRWRLTPQHALYVRAASGYRPGGPLPVFTNPTTGTPLTTGSFKSDSLWSYELGWKSDLLNHRLQLEAAVYQIDWKDIQVFTSEAGFGTIGNAGAATSRGLELSARARPNERWDWSAALSLIDATLDADEPALGGARGERIPDTAEVSAAVQGDYHFSVTGRDAYIGVTARYTSDRYNTFANSPIQQQYRLPAFATVDLRAGMAFESFDLSLFVRNVGNRRGQLSTDNTFSTFGAPARVSLTLPRTVGMQLSTDF